MRRGERSSAEARRPTAAEERRLPAAGGEAERPPSRRGAGPASLRQSRPRAGASVYASPAVRRLARELGVDLSRVEGHRPQGPDHQEDVKAAHGPAAAAAAPGAGIPGLELAPWPQVDFAKYGEIERVPLSRIKKISGPNIARNWVMIPHVTHHDEADITDLEAFRKQINAEQDVKVTMVALLIKACVGAAAPVPRVQLLARRRRAGDQALLPPRLRGRHAAGPAGAGDQGRRPQGPARDRRRAARAVRQGARGQDLGRGDAREHVHDLVARRHRRHRLHPDRQRARGRDPRRHPLGR